MSRRRILNNDEAEAMYQEYRQWLALNPKKLCAKYRVSKKTMHRYIGERMRRAA